MDSSRTFRVLTLLFLFILTSCAAFGANISIPMFRLLTRGAVSDGALNLNTRANIDVALEGGFKFGGRVAFTLLNEDLEAPHALGTTYYSDTVQAALARTLIFSSAEVMVRNTFGTPMELTYFTGEKDTFASGATFPALFGSIPFATDFQGYVYFPEGVSYEGIHTVSGTGFALSTHQWLESLRVIGYLYQDAWLGSGNYSADLRALYNSERLKLEAFLGASFPKGPYGYYRSGLMLYYTTGDGGEFYSQIGVPQFAPGQDSSLTIEHFYFLFEPRVKLGLLSIILTLFWHPETYLLSPTNEDGAVDINAKFLLGDRRETKINGGLENRIALRPGEDTQLTVIASPFLELNSSGVLWDFKLSARLFPFSVAEMFEGFVGVRTEF